MNKPLHGGFGSETAKINGYVFNGYSPTDVGGGRSGRKKGEQGTLPDGGSFSRV